MIGTIISAIIPLISKVLPNTAEGKRLSSEITMALLAKESELQATMRDIAVAEVTGNLFQSSWRPALAWMLIAMLPWIMIIQPVFFPEITTVTHSDFFTVLGLFGSVYGLGRSVEKIGPAMMDKFNRNKKK
ncbi:MAG: hypothetical protein JKY49_00435 [Cohaesibacteraceae bacterium]|nr:hypothetical protein [Cohaesibacteraceae bacterium]MBL4875765.1 hypothetical protein [Cohaesibacteraceae bacterium]